MARSSRRSDAANGNGPFRLHAALDVRIEPGAQFQSGGRPLRRLLEPHQRQVSGPDSAGGWEGGLGPELGMFLPASREVFF